MILKIDKTCPGYTVVQILFFIVLTVCGLVAAERANAGQGASDTPAVRVGGDIKPPIKIKDVKPIYPPAARQTRTQGVVIMDLTIGQDGKVKSVKVLKSLPLLEAAAVTAVQGWEFRPTLVDGKAISVIMTTSVIFKLD